MLSELDNSNIIQIIEHAVTISVFKVSLSICHVGYIKNGV